MLVILKITSLPAYQSKIYFNWFYKYVIDFWIVLYKGLVWECTSRFKLEITDEQVQIILFNDQYIKPQVMFLPPYRISVQTAPNNGNGCEDSVRLWKYFFKTWLPNNCVKVLIISRSNHGIFTSQKPKIAPKIDDDVSNLGGGDNRLKEQIM